MAIARNEIQTMDRVLDNVEVIPATLKDNTGTVINLTGRTVTCQIIDMADGTVIQATGAVTIVSATAGTVTYTPAAGDVDAVGVFAVYFNDDTGRRWPYDGAKFSLNVIATTTPPL